jgi:hypothetical protein
MCRNVNIIECVYIQVRLQLPIATYSYIHTHMYYDLRQESPILMLCGNVARNSSTSLRDVARKRCGEWCFPERTRRCIDYCDRLCLHQSANSIIAQIPFSVNWARLLLVHFQVNADVARRCAVWHYVAQHFARQQ